jgi:hypothetical protein
MRSASQSATLRTSPTKLGADLLLCFPLLPLQVPLPEDPTGAQRFTKRGIAHKA